MTEQNIQALKMNKILIVEDDIELASTYEKFLRGCGYNIRIESRGDNVLSAISDFNPELIILDIILPGLDGFSIMEILHNQESTKKIPILVVSNLGDQDKIDMAVKMGVKDYIYKHDLNMEYLNEKIKWLLNKQ
ncbi:hypothetical protein A3F07_02035 [candidate division WWE3 bacterium RIFCSPHIGHO2_12_FULL_38_15]|uniref:Response regulatory domain-containing protein n=1 Tax=candidate division WWE3 bacterium RIFCSPHIGHO2_02_FULL_38_14 TaxID=1802620 RepID=A0A1F4V8A1_UNCKA|nr:MAG: hypothetical protein A2793_03270 [candidate division WWE3 bacterium RIFCSPHIGHO2_01_FULL_38_45]OGC48660.1 MAG: hypothetical protein A3F07_02035 [candidate division WWE3 bacterium RIFCSPHIGHO2_12_FULL_38_15]OGC53066.1 MAG: hypothetical protein A3B64_01295 [candidate division WWE3 bacterium RIFCSPLOWO2_01_FULL_37_24]OGC53429.1 MAG: hypothetical protein A3D91_00150 [candidate division WWE3 bacterium RIFCSPHIGHO2_02_FULL_38_14]HLB51903.1 response regulator [Patescibacteria group bacterium]